MFYEVFARHTANIIVTCTNILYIHYIHTLYVYYIHTLYTSQPVIRYLTAYAMIKEYTEIAEKMYGADLNQAPPSMQHVQSISLTIDNRGRVAPCAGQRSMA